MTDFRRDYLKEHLRDLTLEERLHGLTFQELLQRLTVEQLLDGVPVKEIEDYLRRLKKRESRKPKSKKKQAR